MNKLHLPKFTHIMKLAVCIVLTFTVAYIVKKTPISISEINPFFKTEEINISEIDFAVSFKNEINSPNWNGVKVNESIDYSALKGYSGKPLSDYQTDILLMVTFDQTCGACLNSIEMLKIVQQKAHEFGITFCLVYFKDEKKDFYTFIQKQSFEIENFTWTEGKEIPKTLKSTPTPTIILLNKDQKTVGIYPGGSSNPLLYNKAIEVIFNDVRQLQLNQSPPK